jgi:hypothetical protein
MIVLYLYTLYISLVAYKAYQVYAEPYTEPKPEEETAIELVQLSSRQSTQYMRK